MKITKYRTVAIIYPHLSLECEVVDGDRKYYPNISVNNKGEQEIMGEDDHWCYCKPMDQLGYDKNGNEIDFSEDYDKSLVDNVDIDEEIIKQMYDFWNRNPVFVNDENWREWE